MYSMNLCVIRTHKVGCKMPKKNPPMYNTDPKTKKFLIKIFKKSLMCMC